MLTQTVAPSVFPVSLTEAKAHLRVDHDAEDDLIDALIAAASRSVQERCGKAIGAQTWVYSFPRPDSLERVRLPVTPVTEVTGISYYDTDDTEQAATVGDFWLFKDDDRAFLEPKRGNTWPNAHTGREDAVSVTFTAGFATVPQTLVQAMLLLVGHWFETRAGATERTLTNAPDAVEMLINVERIGWVQS